MKNIHIEHPEDSVLNGDLTVLDWFTSNGKISAKIDGAPAIVWGRNPANGMFFVGTKSVFNKVKIKINHSHEDIDRNHDGNVARILHSCFDNLPHTDKIYQGDFMGFGGNICYKPNTISYFFEEVITQNIIIAPHTVYFAEDDLRNAVVDTWARLDLNSNDNVLFFRPYITIDEERQNINNMCQFAKQIATLCEFPNDKQIRRITKQLNTCIREDIELDDITLDALASDNEIDINVLRLWKLVWTIKLDMFSYISCNDPVECYIEEEYCDHEGYVLANEFGTYKIVNREGFSRANFNLSPMNQ